MNLIIVAFSLISLYVGWQSGYYYGTKEATRIWMKVIKDPELIQSIKDLESDILEGNRKNNEKTKRN